MNRKLYILILAGLCLPMLIQAQSIVNTVHNLSVSGPGKIKASTESEICVFCHTPHTESARSPLWNKQDPGINYVVYNSSVSSTMEAEPGQPDGASLLCLSCHDGTIALGNVISRQREISFSKGLSTLPAGRSNLGRDLSDDHPVSFAYSPSLSATDAGLKDPSSLQGLVRLERGKMQCTSCHDPHKNLNGDFLVASTEHSGLCMYCHEPAYWNTSAHRSSNAVWNGNGQNPWSHSPGHFNTVSRNACENCHSPHHAGGKARLMNYQAEENNCLNCHNGNVASGTKNIQLQLAKTYRHDVMLYAGVHDPREAALVGNRHVECNDCHNPHAANGNNASAPYVKGALEGVKGISSSGMPVQTAQYEYELCFRCHSSNPATGPATQRQIVQANTLLEFSPNAISFHPVEIKGKNTSMPGLLAPLTVNSMIYCSDCHSSDGSDAPGGPHGSIYPHILKKQYVTTDNTPESAAAYALCYSCHSRDEFVVDGGDNVRRLIHYKHVVEVRVSCNTCHDPHGISNLQGTANRNSHLINFNTNIVAPLNGNLYFQDNGDRSGLCLLRCHNKDHNQIVY